MAALFGEPAVFDAEISEEEPAAGTVSCVWSSVGEPPTTSRTSRSSCSRSRCTGARSTTPPRSSYEDVEPIEGIGDDAFFSPQLGVSTGFRDGDRVAFVTFSVIGTGDAPDSITKKDQVIDLLRLVHDRVA